jgi:hypothetical protein
MKEHKLEHDAYRPLSGRRRLLIVVLALATAATIVLSVLGTPGGAKGPRPPPAPPAPEPAACAPGQSIGCLGGKADVIVPPASAAR